MADGRLIAAALGAVTGVRSTAGLTALAHSATGTRVTRLLARTSRVLASGEVLADKTVDLPARTEPVPLIGRAALGALAAGLFARRAGSSVVQAAALGAACAVATAFAATHLRREITTRTDVPDAAVGAAEDLLLLAGSAWIVRAAEAARPARSRR